MQPDTADRKLVTKIMNVTIKMYGNETHWEKLQRMLPGLDYGNYTLCLPVEGYASADLIGAVIAVPYAGFLFTGRMIGSLRGDKRTVLMHPHCIKVLIKRYKYKHRQMRVYKPRPKVLWQVDK